MCDLFFIVNEIDFANYADGNTPFVSGNKVRRYLRFPRKSIIKTFFQRLVF